MPIWEALHHHLPTLTLKGRAHPALHGGAEQKEQDGGKQLHLHQDGGAVEMVTTVTANHFGGLFIELVRVEP